MLCRKQKRNTLTSFWMVRSQEGVEWGIALGVERTLQDGDRTIYLVLFLAVWQLHQLFYLPYILPSALWHRNLLQIP